MALERLEDWPLTPVAERSSIQPPTQHASEEETLPMSISIESIAPSSPISVYSHIMRDQPSHLNTSSNRSADDLPGNRNDTHDNSPVLLNQASPSSTLVVSSDDTEGQGTKVDSRLPIRQSLSLYGCLVIFGGSILTLGVMAFLIFLWAVEGPAGGEAATHTWRQIMLNDWATRAVTLSSLVLRSVIAAQATVCTSLVAALLIERRQVRLSQITQMSIARSVNDGPQQLLRDVISSRSSKMVFNAGTLLLTVLGLGALGIQFSSTLLLPDFETVILVQDSETVRHNVALTPDNQDAVSDIFATTWPTLQGETALFGELDSNSMAEPDEHGVSHSGPRLRAFLPFESEERTRMKSYKGPAFTLKTEVSCMRPSMDAQIQVHPWSLDLPYASLSGNILYNQTFKDNGINHTVDCFKGYRGWDDTWATLCFPEVFNCTMPSQPDPDIVGWSAAICRLDAVGMDEGEADIDFWQDSPDLYGPTSMIFLAFATNADIADYDINNTRNGLGAPMQSEEWNGYELYPGRFLNISLCFSTLNTTVSSVDMATGSTNLSEPQFKWSTNRSTSNIATLQTFMGGDNVHKSPEDRGILAIKDVQYPIPPPAFTSEVNSTSSIDDTSFSEWALWHGPSAAIWAWASNNESLIVCTSCQSRGFTALKDGAAIFEQIVNTSDRVAVAIDTYIAKLVQNFYYLILPLFDVPGNIEVVFSTEARIPKQWNGLIAVLVMASVDLVCVWVITALYIRNVRYTRQGDFWHTISQLMSEPTLSILKQSNELRDSEVSKLLKVNDPWVSIGRSMDTGKVEVLQVH
ncbi:uncharacterized protein F4822DRAFT_230987 [Hypoxylon trugodes]|uniref:uncharacterized protein n=1 Tax=Hypoxylon trugodes TaxID=326681 RepID=UPI0021941DBF|nr:uncharacterized protein F4822DRAFT_230987 [Hypoxylon trugodes]KAI1390258.1 hypothetical protein F4822DRAFT_230987 [Hypoxylon trugodes]